MATSKPYKAYVNEMGEVLIDFDGDNFRHSYPYTVKRLTLLEEGSSSGGDDLVKKKSTPGCPPRLSDERRAGSSSLWAVSGTALRFAIRP